MKLAGAQKHQRRIRGDRFGDVVDLQVPQHLSDDRCHVVRWIGNEDIEFAKAEICHWAVIEPGERFVADMDECDAPGLPPG